jgi:hypothetical protein
MRKPWVERNAGPEAVRRVRMELKFCGPATYAEVAARARLSVSAVRAACVQLKCLPAPGKGKRLGTSGKFPTLWALPKEKRR